MRIYIDTNVYLDYFLNRQRAPYAFRVFRKSLKCYHQIILSNHAIVELTNIIEYSETRFLFETLKHKIILVDIDDVDREEAKLLPTHYADALHIVLAKKGSADAIITNNIKDFQSIFKTYSPESFR